MKTKIKIIDAKRKPPMATKYHGNGEIEERQLPLLPEGVIVVKFCEDLVDRVVLLEIVVDG